MIEDARNSPSMVNLAYGNRTSTFIEELPRSMLGIDEDDGPDPLGSDDESDTQPSNKSCVEHVGSLSVATAVTSNGLCSIPETSNVLAVGELLFTIAYDPDGQPKVVPVVKPDSEPGVN